jgi:hypothetical protein
MFNDTVEAKSKDGQVWNVRRPFLTTTEKSIVLFTVVSWEENGVVPFYAEVWTSGGYYQHGNCLAMKEGGPIFESYEDACVAVRKQAVLKIIQLTGQINHLQSLLSDESWPRI